MCVVEAAGPSSLLGLYPCSVSFSHSGKSLLLNEPGSWCTCARSVWRRSMPDCRGRVASSGREGRCAPSPEALTDTNRAKPTMWGTSSRRAWCERGVIAAQAQKVWGRGRN
eukprot:6184807-Pleurochrysis_carterae.AAC.3